MRIDIVSIEVYAIFMLIVNVWCDSTQRIVIRRQESFTFDCQQDESVYFARRLGDWSEVQEDNENYHYLNLKFTYLNQEKIQRVTCNTAQSENVGYYGCRKPTWTSTTMTRIYQLILADVQSFYWTYVCHGPAGSCVRADDSQDESRSTFEVADQTKVDLFCCAAVNGYKHIEMKMNSLGDRRDNVEVNRKEELDGAWVICANQHTQFQRISARNKQTLKCELIVDDRSYSTLSSDIDIKDAMPVDPDMDIPFVDETPSRESPNKDNDYFHRRRPSASGKLTTGANELLLLLVQSSVVLSFAEFFSA